MLQWIQQSAADFLVESIVEFLLSPVILAIEHVTMIVVVQMINYLNLLESISAITKNLKMQNLILMLDFITLLS